MLEIVSPKSSQRLKISNQKVPFNKSETFKRVAPCTPLVSVNETRPSTMTSTAQKNQQRLGDTTSRLGSPIPCGDSFFEDEMIYTQTHKSFISSFKRDSFGASNAASNSSNATASSPLSINSRQEASDMSSSQTKMNNFNPPNKNPKFDLPQLRGISQIKDSLLDCDTYDSFDDKMNLHLAENFAQDDFTFDYKITETAKPANVLNKGDNSLKSSRLINKGDNSAFYDELKEDVIDDFDDDDEDFNQVLSQNDVPAISKTNNTNNRQSFGMNF